MVARDNQIVKINSLEAAAAKYCVLWGVAYGKDQKVTAPKLSISGQLTMDVTI